MRAASIAAAVLLLAAAYAVVRRNAAATDVPTDGSTPEPSLIDSAAEWINDAADTVLDGYLMPVKFNLEDLNLRAFLAMIRYCEGTGGDDGYSTMYGGGTFDSFADHPRKVNCYQLGGRQICSSAAGAYQFLTGTWDEAKAALGLPDFSPASQDAAAAFLIRRRGALADVYAGKLSSAVRKCAKEWASLPGSPYGQPTKTDADVRRMFVAAGGTLTDGVVYA